MVFEDKFIKTNFIGIIINIILVILKISIGILTNSSAIYVDGLNNINGVVTAIGDVISSKINGTHNPQIYNRVGRLTSIVVSLAPILSSKIAETPPDNEYPHGRGRVEYITPIFVSGIVLYVSILAIQDSVFNLIYPKVVVYNNLFLTLIGFSIVVKIALGFYFRSRGKNLNNPDLIGSGKEEFKDSLVSFSTLIVALISIKYNVSLEGVLGLFISILVIKSGYSILMENTHKLMGPAVNKKYVEKIMNSIREVPGVNGVYNISLHDYGPQRMEGSAYIIINDYLTAKEIHDLSSTITSKIYDEFSIIMVIGVIVGDDYYYMYPFQ